MVVSYRLHTKETKNRWNITEYLESLRNETPKKVSSCEFRYVHLMTAERINTRHARGTIIQFELYLIKKKKKKKEKKKKRTEIQRGNKWDIKRKEINLFYCMLCIYTSFRVFSNWSNRIRINRRIFYAYMNLIFDLFRRELSLSKCKKIKITWLIS